MTYKTVLYESENRLARVTLNRPEVLNAINDDMPKELQDAVERANEDNDVHVIVLSGAGDAFCSGYDLTAYAEDVGGSDDPWDPMADYSLMMSNTRCFMSLWRCQKPVVCKVHGHAVAGGSDIALCSDVIIAAEDAVFGYMPARVWGCPTTAMWVYRLGIEQAKRLLLTGDKIDAKEAERIGLICKAAPPPELDATVDALAKRMASVPRNQLMMQKLMINQAVEAMGLHTTQMIATLFDGISRHSPEGAEFQRIATEEGWKSAVEKRDRGNYDWTNRKPI